MLKSILASFLCLAFVGADSPDKPHSRAALDAIEQHDRSLRMIEVKHKTDVALADKEFADALKVAQAAAMRGNDLAEANRIEKAGKAVAIPAGDYILYDDGKPMGNVSLRPGGVLLSNGESYKWETANGLVVLNYKTVTKVLAASESGKFVGISIGQKGARQSVQLVPTN